MTDTNTNPTPELNQPSIEHQEQVQAPQTQETQPDTFGKQYMKQLDQRFTTLDPNQRADIQAWLSDIDSFSQNLTPDQTKILQAGMNGLLANEPTRSSAEHMAKAIEKIMTDLMNSNELVYTDGDYFRLIVGETKKDLGWDEKISCNHLHIGVYYKYLYHNYYDNEQTAHNKLSGRTASYYTKPYGSY